MPIRIAMTIANAPDPEPPTPSWTYSFPNTVGTPDSLFYLYNKEDHGMYMYKWEGGVTLTDESVPSLDIGYKYDMQIDSDGTIYVAGGHNGVGKLYRKKLGESWELQTIPETVPGIPTNSFFCISINEFGIYVAGGNWDERTTCPCGPYKLNTETDEWEVVGPGYLNNCPEWFNGNISSMCVRGTDDIYVVGDFDSIGGVTANKIAHWNGTTWEPIGSGVGVEEYGYLNSIIRDVDGRLFIGGSFTTIDGVSASNIAYLLDESWNTLGEEGVGGKVTSLKFVKNRSEEVHLMVCGQLFFVNGSSYSSPNIVYCSNFATWHPIIGWNVHSHPMLGLSFASFFPEVVCDDSGMYYALLLKNDGGTLKTSLYTYPDASWTFKLYTSEAHNWNVLGIAMK